MQKTDLIIIGGGCAGYSAAIYAGRAGINGSLFEGQMRGGQLSITTDVENYPGFAETIQGPWLMEQMRSQAERFGIKIIGDVVTEVQLHNGNFLMNTDSSGEILARALIVATGANAKWLEVAGENKYRNKGVSACATCDGFFFRGKDVVVVGGGNVAVEDSMFLSNMAKSVTLVHRRDSLRAEKILQNKLFALVDAGKMKIIWDSVVDEILGSDTHVTGVRLRSTKNDSMREIQTNGVFVAIGHAPNTDIVKEIVDLDMHGYIKTIPGSSKTGVPGLFAAGDVQDAIYRQAVTSAGTGCMAALDAEKYLAAGE